MEIAEKTGAIPFDTPGAELHHRDALCTFDVIIEDYELTDKALLRMAKDHQCRRHRSSGCRPVGCRFRSHCRGL